MAHEPQGPDIDGRLRSARRFIAAGYCAILLGGAIGFVLPRGRDELGLANLVLAFALGLVCGGLLLLTGIVRGVQAGVQARGRLGWWNYIILVIGAAPFVLAAALLMLPG